MHLKNTESAYGLIAKSIHWIMAGLMIFLLFLGISMMEIDPSPAKWQAYGLHKALGILVLALVVIRILWKLTAGKPAPIDTHQKWERALSHLIHGLLYLGMIGMPLSGWVMSSAGGHPISFFGLFEVPPLVEKNPEIGKIARSIHDIAGTAIILAILFHFAGAAKHHIMDKDNTLMRMIANNRMIALITLIVFGVFLIAPVAEKISQLTKAPEIEEPKETPETKTDSP